MTPATDSAIPLLADLVAIPSVNPDLVPGAAGEAAIADFCAAWLSDHGFEVHRLEARPGCRALSASAGAPVAAPGSCWTGTTTR